MRLAVGRAVAGIAGALATTLAVAPGGAWAAPAPAWRISSEAVPTSFSPGGRGEYLLHVRNVGTLPTDGSTVTVVDRLPPGVTAVAAGERRFEEEGAAPGSSYWMCSGTTVVTCTNNPGNLPVVAPGQELTGGNEGPTAPLIAIEVTVAPGALGSVANVASVFGGGGGEASSSQQTTIGSLPSSFGFQDFEQLSIGRDGSPDTQAGSHPYEMTTRFAFDNLGRPRYGEVLTSGEVKNLEVVLPPGFVGNPSATPKCSRALFDLGRRTNEEPACPRNTQVGTVELSLENPFTVFLIPVYNLEPPANVAAQFGFAYQYRTGFIDFGVSTGAGYAVKAVLSNAYQLSLLRSYLTLWGVPGEHGTGAPLAPLLTNPTSCGAPLAATVNMNSWEEPGNVLSGLTYPWTDGMGNQLQMGGCGKLDFSPSIEVRPTTTRAASTPTGLEVDVKVPQNERLEGLAEAHLKDAVVALPAGVTVSPSAANGLQACTPAQIGLHNGDEPSCPDASRIGDVEVRTPLLEQPLHGSVYVAQQDENPFHSLLAIYVVAEGSGTLVKLAGHVEADPATGQLTTRFTENPQLPFSELKLSFFSGPRAALVTPAACGRYTPSAQLAGYNGAMVIPAIEPFSVLTGCAHGFSPSFTAGMENAMAGGFAPFTTTITRPDGDQALGAVSVSTPAGLLGMLSRVSPCGEPQAALGACSQSSLIGHTTATAGPGPYPVTVSGGQVFLTGPYRGAPFGLSIVVPAVAGPFDLGNIVVRASISVDPHTARITIVSDPLPTIKAGIPLQIRSVTVTVDRAGFMFAPTSCAPMSVDGTIASAQGASATVSSRFQVADCASLRFHPGFAVSTQGHTSKKGGASLDVRVTSAAGQANIAKVAVALPKQLPSRLTTLQHACPEATFAQNPAACSAASLVGIAKAVTPVLSEPLSGPAYLVSHGGAAFPDLVVILQGQGIRLDLAGNTNIKGQITTSTFASVPDAPIGSFELVLPQGSHSALTTNLPAKVAGNLCTTKLVMPTTITGQNGAQLIQSTRIAVRGCPKRGHIKKTRR
jgi:uncharacterized repeat protein (TIGR01451 family)